MKKIIWIIYIILIAFIIIYFWKISPIGSRENINAEAPFGLYKDMITMIKRDNYIFNYSINIEDKTYKYIGKRVEDQFESVAFLNEEEISSEELLSNINENFLEPNYIFDILKDEKYQLNSDKNKKVRNYIYDIKVQDKKTIIIVYTDVTSITNITIEYDNQKYDLKYENIGFTVIN